MSSRPSLLTRWFRTRTRTSGSDPRRWGNRFRLMCESLEDRVVPDAGPRVTAVTPLEVRNAAFDHVDVQFSRDIDGTTFTPSDVTLAGLSGAVAITGVTMTGLDTARVDFAPITVRGSYTLTIGPDVRDTLDNQMDQNQNNVAGEAADTSVSSLVYISADAIFTSATTITETNLSYDGKDVLIDGATVAIDGSHTFNSVHIVNGGVLTHTANTATATHKIDFDVTEQVIVSASSRVDVTGQGYLPGRTTGNTAAGGAVGYGGGSYGGRGSEDSNFSGPHATNAAYGDYADPGDWGAGSGPAASARAGGGLVRVRAGALVLDGAIRADGAMSFGVGGGGGGAGGGVYVSADTLAGAGLINAAGSPGHGSHPFSGAPGGGGRVAVYYRTNGGFDLARVTATGTSGAQNGSIFILQGYPHTHVRLHSPAGVPGDFVGKGNGFVSQLIDSITLSLNNPIDLGTFAPAAFEITGPSGRVTPTGMTLVGDRTYRIDLPAPLTENGTYHFRLLPTVKDAEGFFLDQDADGNPGEALDDVYAFDLTVDTVGPRVTQHAPAGDVSGTISSVDVFFGERLDAAQFTAADITITRPDGQTAAVASLTDLGLNRYRITFAPQTLVGRYHVRVGPDVRDPAGNKLDIDRDGVFGEATDDVHDATFNLVAVDLGLHGLTVSATELVAGEPVRIGWQGQNQTGAELLGEWIDVVYLSADGQWDANDRILGTFLHTGGLAAGQTYGGSVSVLIPGVLPGNYRILVRADVANQERETDEANNLIASDTVSLSVRALPASGVPANGSLSRHDHQDFYAVQVPAGQSLRLTLDGLSTTSRNELYVARGFVPTPQLYNERATAQGADQDLVLTGAPEAGTYYVLVSGNHIASDIGDGYTLSASTAEFFVTSISPETGGNAGNVTILIRGAGFPEGPVDVRLVTGDQPDVVGIDGVAIESTTIVATFDLRGVDPGSRNVQLTFANGQGALLSGFSLGAQGMGATGTGGMFTVADGGSGILEVLFDRMSSSARVGGTISFNAVVRNIGTTDLALATVKVTANLLNGGSGRATLLDTVVGGLPPGAAITFPLSFQMPNWCLSVLLNASEVPDPCDQLRVRVDALLVDRQIVRNEITHIRQEYNAVQDQINTCGCGTLSQTCDPIECLILIITRNQLLDRLATKLHELRLIERELAAARQALEDCERNSGTASSSSSLGSSEIHYSDSGTLSHAETSLSVCPVRSSDPNDKLKPVSHGDEGFIRPDTPFSYQVRFENMPDATAPAALVEITDTLDAGLDLDTFEFTEITFANQRISVPPGLSHYETTVPIVANGVNILVEVRASLDRDTRTLTLTLRAVDPTTGWLPEDPLLGLLYPNDASGRGQGSVSYRVSPLPGLSSGTVIENRARIYFDFNDPIDTPLVRNTLDAAGPSSRVTTPSGTVTGDAVTLTWEGTDDANGSGIARYDLFASADGGEWFQVVFGTTATTVTLPVAPGHTYGFYTIATDNVGHVEAAPATPDAVIQVAVTPQVTAVRVNGTTAPAANVTASRVTSLTVAFNVPVSSIDPGAFTLTRGATTLASGAGGAISVSGLGTGTLTLTFNGAAGVEAGSLADGVWTLTTDLSKVHAGGAAGAGTHAANHVRRLFGDGNGDGTVTLTDFGLLGATFGKGVATPGYNAAFDWNNDGSITLTDFGAFGQRFGKGL